MDSKIYLLTILVLLLPDLAEASGLAEIFMNIFREVLEYETPIMNLSLEFWLKSLHFNLKFLRTTQRRDSLVSWST